MYKLDYKNAKKAAGFGLPFILVGLLFFVIIAILAFGGMIKKLSLDSVVTAYDVQLNTRHSSEGRCHLPTNILL